MATGSPGRARPLQELPVRPNVGLGAADNCCSPPLLEQVAGVLSPDLRVYGGNSAKKQAGAVTIDVSSAGTVKQLRAKFQQAASSSVPMPSPPPSSISRKNCTTTSAVPSNLTSPRHQGKVPEAVLPPHSYEEVVYKSTPQSSGPPDLKEEEDGQRVEVGVMSSSGVSTVLAEQPSSCEGGTGASSETRESPADEIKEQDGKDVPTQVGGLSQSEQDVVRDSAQPHAAPGREDQAVFAFEDTQARTIQRSEESTTADVSQQVQGQEGSRKERNGVQGGEIVHPTGDQLSGQNVLSEDLSLDGGYAGNEPTTGVQNSTERSVTAATFSPPALDPPSGMLLAIEAEATDTESRHCGEEPSEKDDGSNVSQPRTIDVIDATEVLRGVQEEEPKSPHKMAGLQEGTCCQSKSPGTCNTASGDIALIEQKTLTLHDPMLSPDSGVSVEQAPCSIKKEVEERAKESANTQPPVDKAGPSGSQEAFALSISVDSSSIVCSPQKCESPLCPPSGGRVQKIPRPRRQAKFPCDPAADPHHSEQDRPSPTAGSPGQVDNKQHSGKNARQGAAGRDMWKPKHKGVDIGWWEGMESGTNKDEMPGGGQQLHSNADAVLGSAGVLNVADAMAAMMSSTEGSVARMLGVEDIMARQQISPATSKGLLQLASPQKLSESASGDISKESSLAKSEPLDEGDDSCVTSAPQKEGMGSSGEDAGSADDINRLDDESAVLQRIGDLADGDRRQMRNQLKRERDQRQRMVQEIQRAEEKQKELENMVAELQKRIVKEEELRTKAETFWRDQIDQSNERIDELKARSSKKDDDIRKQQQEVSKQRSLLKLQKKEVEAAKLESEAKAQALASAERELDELRTALGALKQKEKGYATKCQTLLTTLREVRQQQSTVGAVMEATLTKWKAGSQQMLALVDKLGKENEKWRSLYAHECELRKQAHNKMMELRGNIRVFSRTRPMLDKDRTAGGKMSVEFDPLNPGTMLAKGTNGKLKEFEFDRSFPPEATQEEVFEETSDVVISVMDGYDVCIFAYGQTGTGKTHTMEGDQSRPGMNVQTLEKLFQVKQERRDQAEYSILMSVIEVYNEQIRDLLAPTLEEKDQKDQKKLEVKQQPDGRHYVPGVVEQEVASAAEAWEVLRKGAGARAVQSTKSNNQSSRSHCLVCVTVKSRKAAQPVERAGSTLQPALSGGQGSGSWAGSTSTASTRTLSRLWLVDLAGSERVAKSEVTGDRLNETKSINSSLLHLGDVIFALSNKANFVNFRSSKLTMLLQDSLGGHAKVLMLVHVSPSDKDASETTASLNFATKARGVELGPAKRQVDTLALKGMADRQREQTEQAEHRAKQQKDELESALTEALRKLEQAEQREAQAQKKAQQLERALVAARAGAAVPSEGASTGGNLEPRRTASGGKSGEAVAPAPQSRPQKEAVTSPEQSLARTQSGRAHHRTASAGNLSRGVPGPVGILATKPTSKTPSPNEHLVQLPQPLAAQQQVKKSPLAKQSLGSKLAEASTDGRTSGIPPPAKKNAGATAGGSKSQNPSNGASAANGSLVRNNSGIPMPCGAKGTSSPGGKAAGNQPSRKGTSSTAVPASRMGHTARPPQIAAHPEQTEFTAEEEVQQGESHENQEVLPLAGLAADKVMQGQEHAQEPSQESSAPVAGAADWHPTSTVGPSDEGKASTGRTTGPQHQTRGNLPWQSSTSASTGLLNPHAAPFIFQASPASATPGRNAYRSGMDSSYRPRAGGRRRNSDIGIGGRISRFGHDDAGEKGSEQPTVPIFSPSAARYSQRSFGEGPLQLSGMKHQRGPYSEWFETWTKKQRATEGADQRYHSRMGFKGHANGWDFGNRLETVPEFHPGCTDMQPQVQPRKSYSGKPPLPRTSSGARATGSGGTGSRSSSHGFGIGARQSMFSVKDDSAGYILRASKDLSFSSNSSQSSFPSAASAASRRRRRKSVASSNPTLWKS